MTTLALVGGMLTLLLTPVAYSLFDDLAGHPAWRRLFATRRRGEAKAVEAN